MLLPGDLPALRPVPAPLLHLTLAFIGNTPPDRLGAASEAVRAAAAVVAPFDVVLDGVGRFPVRGLPNVVWLGAGEGADGLILLGQRVRAALRERSVPFDDKPFRPHITLARVKRDVERAAFVELTAALRAVEAPSLRFRADAVHLVESRLSPRGPRYASLQTVPLSA